MTFRDWQQLSPEEAARELRRRVHTLLSPAQQRAVFAYLPSDAALAASFAAADRHKPLGGIPYFLKDLFDVRGLPTFAGSTFLPEVRPTPEKDSRIVEAFNTAGAVFAGKTHLHEFAYGITGENPHYGDCEHPRFPDRTTGGSSSGSAAAVAAGIVPLSIGSDTGGSVRVPAAFCGLFGFRLTPGDAFVADGFPLSPSFDTAGWFTANAADMTATLGALVRPKRTERKPRGFYLELPGLEPEIASAIRHATERFASEVDLATRDGLLAGFSNSLKTYNTIAAAEAWRVHQGWAESYRERYDPAVWQRLQRGVILSESDYQNARTAMATIRGVWDEFFASFDFLILPATPFAALTKPECTLANRSRLLALTAPASLGGLPVLTLPVHLDLGLTGGLQIVVKTPDSPVLTWALKLES